jgi:hypothetical protein
MFMKKNKCRVISIAFCLLFFNQIASAQTDIDGLMMQKNFFCVGPTAGYSSWKNYWEGDLKRENLNLGKVSASNVMVMGNYGVTNKLNVLFGLPYIKTKASAGNFKGQKGLQDLSLFVKWMAKEKKIGKGNLKGIVIGGYSTPVSDYSADLLPFSIGLRSKTAMVRLMADYEVGDWFATLSGTYNFRNNITIDRESYYTTEMHYTHEVKIPDATYFNFRAGYRSSTWIVEAIADQWTTLGGFDITRNNMPFPSNEMNATKLGIHIKYDTDFVNGLSFVADANTTVAGRNVGQSTSFGGGVFYILDFSKKQKEETKK